MKMKHCYLVMKLYHVTCPGWQCNCLFLFGRCEAGGEPASLSRSSDPLLLGGLAVDGAAGTTQGVGADDAGRYVHLHI